MAIPVCTTKQRLQYHSNITFFSFSGFSNPKTPDLQQTSVRTDPILSPYSPYPLQQDDLRRLDQVDHASTFLIYTASIPRSMYDFQDALNMRKQSRLPPLRLTDLLKIGDLL
ncbi:hypothetical protein MRB53_023272 [Persea americana]|uniref:Uncharacterized protein n=1 Tax=Persea americana TaxID=3435 RepID=A0ACC2L8Y8_PERAE|nr:hypothetical protein MRB53_023272 [Persea americana]